MGIGTGVIEGTDVWQLVGIRPGDTAHESVTGAVFHPQDENLGGNMAFYEIQDTSDEIDFNIGQYIFGLDDPVLALYTVWGASDFTLVERTSEEEVVAEQSGYDTNVWFADVSSVSGDLRLTNFETDSGVNGTEAGWLPYVGILDQVV